MNHEDVLSRFDIRADVPGVAIGATWSRSADAPPIPVRSPIDGALVCTVGGASRADVAEAIDAASDAFRRWRVVPAPRRGELVRRIGQRLRERKADLAALVTLEAGKIIQEALGEVQEMIDVCDFAVGLSRQLHGLTIASERPGHRMMEQWHPLGPVGVITAFNFPVAVWAWNAMLALVCGDPVVWKPSEKTPLTAIACHKLACEVVAEMGDVPDGLLGLVVGAKDVGEALAASERVPLVSATGSTRMGRELAPVVARRLGRCLLELGGNNGMILAPSADREMAIRAITFAAFGTAGQRCTSLRRLIVHESIADETVARLKRVIDTIRVGDPRADGVLVGPLIDKAAWERASEVIYDAVHTHDGRAYGWGRAVKDTPKGGVYVRPAIVEITPDAPMVAEETFAPILYVLRYRDLAEAIAIHNDVPQGLSSAIFTSDVREAETFLSPAGSDCGIANVNIGTSGAEIGGAFGGEKATGGGRESGSDAWRNYMRRTTNTINYSTALPLAQGIEFDVGS